MTPQAPLHPTLPPATAAERRRPGLLRRVQSEWESMRVDPVLVHRAEGWALGITIDSLDDVLVAAGWHRTVADRLAARGGTAGTPGVDAEQTMRRLVELAHDDQLAARVVLQRLLPGLVQRARCWSARADGSPHALEELLAAAWLAIRSYRLDRRTGPLVPSLLTDAEYHAFVRQGRRTARHEPHPHEHFDRLVGERHPSAWDELHDLLASVLVGGRTPLTPTDRRLLGLLLSGCGPDEVASRLGVSVRTATNRRHDLVERLRSAVLADAA